MNPQEDTNMSLAELLAGNPTARAEHETALVEARKEGEKKGREDIMAIVEKVTPIMSSDEYTPSVKQMGILAIKGEKSFEAFEAVVAMADMQKEQAKSAAAASEQPDETPGGGEDGDAAKEQAEFEARKARLGEGV